MFGTRTDLSHPETDRHIHRRQIEAYGGLHGLRNEDGLESAIAQPQSVYFYGGGDLCEIAAAYAFHIAESQAYFDGNKRVGVQAALNFLDTYEAMIRVAKHELNRPGLTVFFRDVLQPAISTK